MDDEFSMYVISNGSSEYYSDNTLSKFSVKLPFSLDLPTSYNEKWGIAIQGMGLSSKFTSDYTENNRMPLMIEMLSYFDFNACQSLGDKHEKNKCFITRNTANKLIKSGVGFCFDDVASAEHCINDAKITEQLNAWAKNNVKSTALLKITGEHVDENSLVYNYFFNTLKDRTSLDRLKSRLVNNSLSIQNADDTNFSIANKIGTTFERIFFIRQDLYSKSEITQDTNFTPYTNVIEETAPEELNLFYNLINARVLNNSSVILDNTTYKLLVLNKEFTKININFKQFSENYLSAPNIIKIKCENIVSQIYNNQRSKDIEVIKPRFYDKSSHYFHEFENPVFVPLLNTRLRDLTFELTDEYDNRLMLSEGLPTLLQLSFKRMSNDSKSFSIRLTPSFNNSDNSTSKFTNILPATLNLNENWRVGLKEITFPSSIKSLPNDDNHIVVTRLGDMMQHMNYPDYTCPILNEAFDKTSLVRNLNVQTAMLDLLTFSLKENCLYVTSKENCEIGVSYYLAKFLNLGLLEAANFSLTQEKVKMIINANVLTKIGNPINWQIFRPAYLMIYSDLVKPSLISSVYTNILRIVPVRKEEKNVEYQSQEFKNVEYRGLANNFVNIINIQVRSHSGELVQFNSNFLSLHLYFTNESH